MFRRDPTSFLNGDLEIDRRNRLRTNAARPCASADRSFECRRELGHALEAVLAPACESLFEERIDPICSASCARIPPDLFSLKLLCRFPAAIGNDLILNVLAFIERAQPGPLNRGDVHEHILAAALRLDKAVTLGRVEPLHSACSHS